MRRLAVIARLKRRRRDERGVVLVLVALLMVVFLGLAALAIDLGFFYQQQRQAQSAADAAALAGAQDLPGSATNATAKVKTYVISNMPGVPQVYSINTCASPPTPGVCITTPYNSNPKQIQVTVTQTVPTFFGHIFGVNSTNVSATAVAANTASTLCSTPGNNCYAIFANDSTCTSGHYAIQITGAGDTITGGILTNGSASVFGAGMSLGPSTYGPAAGCGWNTFGAGINYSSGPSAAAAPTTNWPIDYATDFPPCSGATCTGACAVVTTPCPAASKTPSFCTVASTVASLSLTPTSGNIYCAIGSGIAQTPSTWNGALSISGSGITAEATYVAGSVSIFGAGINLTACGYNSAGSPPGACNAGVPTPTTGNYPLIYATGAGTSSGNIDDTGAGNVVKGDMFAPNGTINFTGAGGSVGFLEGNDVTYTGAGLTGDGPSDTGTGSSTSGLASLVQ